MSLAGSVLIIDDEASLRHTLTRVLRQAGCEVVSAESGPEALQQLAAGHFDLIYLDIRLPGMDGVQILKEIRRQDARLPVILLTAYGSLQTALEALRLGAADYLLKPVNPEVLVARTRAIMQEQAVERRRREIQEQIEALQEELRLLDQVGELTGVQAAAQPAANLGAPAERFLRRGRLVLDLHTRRATFGEKVLALPPTTFDYLLVLARHSPETIDYQTLVNEAQGYQTNTGEARQLAKWHVHLLREALDPEAGSPGHILNVRGVGYRLVT